MSDILLEELWHGASPGEEVFSPDRVAHLPETARRYLTHAIAPGTPLASAVRLRMHGEIKLQRWFPFEAEQVIHWERGMIWKATARVFGIPIRGFDRIVDGEGAMRWKLLGLIPLITADGPDISRASAGRLHAETTWLPSALCSDGVEWTGGGKSGKSQVSAHIHAHDHTHEIKLAVGEGGRLASIAMQRWGDLGDGFQYERFGGIVDEEGTFGGYTIPTRLRIGWHVGTDRFESDGEFFRGVVDEAVYR